MSVSVEVRWSQSVADSVLKHPQSALLKFQGGIGVVSVYSTKLGEELLLGDVSTNFVDWMRWKTVYIT